MTTDTRPARRFALPWFAWAGGALVILAAAAFGYWTISPLFISTTVDEAFPTSAAVIEAAPTADAPASAAGEAMAAESMAAEARPTAAPTAASPAAAPAGPVALSAGSFTTIDSLHGASGSATIYRLPEGGLVLRLADFAAQNGPDLFVGLSGHPMPRSSDEVHQGGYLELARLKANQGNQNYELPADIDLSQYKSVVIYCRAFSVVFSTAELAS